MYISESILQKYNYQERILGLAVKKKIHSILLNSTKQIFNYFVPYTCPLVFDVCSLRHCSCVSFVKCNFPKNLFHAHQKLAALHRIRAKFSDKQMSKDDEDSDFLFHLSRQCPRLTRKTVRNEPGWKTIIHLLRHDLLAIAVFAFGLTACLLVCLHSLFFLLFALSK